MKSRDWASISRSIGLCLGRAPGNPTEVSPDWACDCAIAELPARTTMISVTEAVMTAGLAEFALRSEMGPVCGTPDDRILVGSSSGRAREEIEQHPDQAVQNQHLHAAEPSRFAVLRDLADDEHTAEDRRHLCCRKENVHRVAEKRRSDDQNGNDKEGNLSSGANPDLEREVHL